MRRSKEEKHQTHTHIVEIAAQQFRTEGFKEIGIAELMGEAGLTHGGFYAHFDNKEALIAEVFTTGLADTLQKLINTAEHASAGEELAAIIDAYLTTFHRDHPASGCVIPTLASDVPRHSAEVRAAFTHAFKDFLERIEDFIHKNVHEDQCDDALVLLAGMAGTILIARAIDDPELSNRILSANRNFYKQQFAL